MTLLSYWRYSDASLGKLTDLPHGLVLATALLSMGCGLDDVPELEPDAAVQAPEIPPPEDPQLRAPGPDLDPMARCAVARERATEVLVADRARHAIVAVDVASGRVLGDLVGPDAGGPASHDRLDRPVDATLLSDGSLVVANFGPGSVLHFDGETGEYLDTLFYDTRVLEEPTAVRWTGEHLLVLGNDSGNLLVLDESGTATSTMGDPGLRFPLDLALGPEPGTVFLTGARNTSIDATVQLWDYVDGERLAWFSNPDPSRPSVGVVVDCHDAVLLSDPAGVTRLRPAGQPDRWVRDRELPVDAPSRLRTAPDGQVWVSSKHGLSRLDTDDGGFILEIGTEPELLEDPRGFAFR